jgi:alkanesulfonate monooxygenase SsuD/methylene tetrahydromethanopterin reductase-like flavin-dependent oxidoreductase (luciferase family)
MRALVSDLRLSAGFAFSSTPIATGVELALELERGGFERVWIEEAWREPVVPVAATTLGTTSIGVATGIAQIFPVNPVVVAQQAAQLDEISCGRFTLGLGLGASFVVERWFGVDYERPLTRAREFIEVVRGVLASPENGPFSYEGAVFNVRKYRLPFAERAPRVPIYLAAVGPKMQELAGEVADGIVVGALHSPRYMELVQERLATGAQRGGRSAADVDVAYFLPCAVSHDSARARELVKWTLAYTAQYPHYQKILVDEGLEDEVERIYRSLRERDFEGAHAAVTDEMVDRFTVAGTIDECRQQLRRYADYPGVPVLSLIPFRIGEDEVVESLRLSAQGLTAAGTRATTT